MAKFTKVVAGVISYRLLVAGGASACATLGMSSCPGLGASAQSLELCCCRMHCIRRRCYFYFYFYPCCCQFRHRQPCCRRCSLCRRSLAFLCHGNLDFLPMLHARGDRALRLSFGHAALVESCCMGKMLPQTSSRVGEEG
jgi:hypothetical protein